jgi:hypothetical protein
MKKVVLFFLLLILSSKVYALDNEIEEIVKNLTKNQNVEIRNLPLENFRIPGFPWSLDRKSNPSMDGTYALIKDKNSAFHGEKYFLFTPSYSQCKRNKSFADCKHSEGTTRTEYTSIPNYVLTKGKELWIHMALKPVNNILYGKNEQDKKGTGKYSTKNYAMQCYGEDGWNIFMLGFQYNKYGEGATQWTMAKPPSPALAINLQQARTGYDSKTGEELLGGPKHTNAPTFYLKKYNPDEINKNYGSDKWTKVVIHIKHEDNSDGFFKFYVDGVLVDQYKGPTFNPKLRKDGGCSIKFGNVSIKLKPRIKTFGKESAEKMAIAIDALAFGRTEEEMLKNISD